MNVPRLKESQWKIIKKKLLPEHYSSKTLVTVEGHNLVQLSYFSKQEYVKACFVILIWVKPLEKLCPVHRKIADYIIMWWYQKCKASCETKFCFNRLCSLIRIGIIFPFSESDEMSYLSSLPEARKTDLIKYVIQF